MNQIRNSIKTYRIEVDFLPIKGLCINNGSDDLQDEEYISSMYVIARSNSEAIQKFKSFIVGISKSHNFSGSARSVSGIQDYPMDERVIKCRNEESILSNGGVVLGWIL
jgi:hypothetical protein